MADLWTFLTDENNRGALTLIGGALATLCGAGWAVFVYLRKKPEPPAGPGVRADRQGVAIGGSVSRSTIRTGNTTGQ